MVLHHAQDGLDTARLREFLVQKDNARNVYRKSRLHEIQKSTLKLGYLKKSE